LDLCENQNKKALRLRITVTWCYTNKLSAMGVRRYFSRGSRVDNLLILFSLLTMLCKWTYTKRFTIS